MFVASAVAPLTASDCALLDDAAENTDLVIGAVSKVDVHRDWGDVLAADTEIAAAHARGTPTWSGWAWPRSHSTASHDSTSWSDALERGLAHRLLTQRNRLRVRQSRLREVVRHHDDAGRAREARVTALRNERSEILRRHRLAKSERDDRLAQPHCAGPGGTGVLLPQPVRVAAR